MKKNALCCNIVPYPNIVVQYVDVFFFIIRLRFEDLSNTTYLCLNKARVLSYTRKFVIGTNWRYEYIYLITSELRVILSSVSSPNPQLYSSSPRGQCMIPSHIRVFVIHLTMQLSSYGFTAHA